MSCTIRNDRLILLRRLHLRDDVTRIVVLLAPWLEPEPICLAINEVQVHVGVSYIDGPAARDVRIEAVLTTIDTHNWLPRELGAEEPDDGRTIAQVVVGQAECADLLVLNHADPHALAVTRRLAPPAPITVGLDRIEQALEHLEPNACTPPSTCSSTASSAPVAGHSWPTDQTTSWRLSSRRQRPDPARRMPTPQLLPVTVLSGFLGAGKTLSIHC